MFSKSGAYFSNCDEMAQMIDSHTRQITTFKSKKSGFGFTGSLSACKVQLWSHFQVFDLCMDGQMDDRYTDRQTDRQSPGVEKPTGVFHGRTHHEEGDCDADGDEDLDQL